MQRSTHIRSTTRSARIAAITAIAMLALGTATAGAACPDYRPAKSSLGSTTTR